MKSFSGSTSIFGSFEFESIVDVHDASQAQKERRVRRRKPDPIAEKRPTTVTETESGAVEIASSKVEIVFNTIKEVEFIIYNIYALYI